MGLFNCYLLRLGSVYLNDSQIDLSNLLIVLRFEIGNLINLNPRKNEHR